MVSAAIGRQDGNRSGVRLAIESDTYKPGMKVLTSLSKALGVSIAYLLEGPNKAE